ncbi:NADPH-dependent F420 reductase [Kribbia dieselivorans]|uniref:NADPH-dependent F420 reductase n=1 Tax=Kribbia dieselivorans TaxID=331526 RepID=UPI0008393B40|nr:NAD(P)-binding domain-containing protein [Kribbia dieselivorans]
MSTVSIFGTGNMGSAIASVVERGGNVVECFGENDAAKPVTGEIVVLAVPYHALTSIAAERAEQFAGRIVVDITNPVNFETFDSLTVPTDSSAAAELAAALPNSRVLKAFNTTFAATLATGKIGDLTTTVQIAGDDADAKAALSEVVTAGGLNVIDAGSLKRARELEAFGFLQISLAAAEKIAWTGGFAVQA